MINIPLRVKNFIKKHGSTNPVLLSKGENIDIVYWDLPASIRGFLVRVLRRKIIFVNEHLSELQQDVVICHELGHAKLHKGYGYVMHTDMIYYVPSRREHEANEFALNLVINSKDIEPDLALKMLNEIKTNPKLVHRMLCELAECDYVC